MSRPIWRPGASLLVASLDLPLTESLSVPNLNSNYNNFKKGICNIKTKIPKKSIEFEGQEGHKGIHIY